MYADQEHHHDASRSRNRDLCRRPLEPPFWVSRVEGREHCQRRPSRPIPHLYTTCRFSIPHGAVLSRYFVDRRERFIPFPYMHLNSVFDSQVHPRPIQSRYCGSSITRSSSPRSNPDLDLHPTSSVHSPQFHPPTNPSTYTLQFS